MNTSQTRAAGPEELTLDVVGMHCNGCAGTVTDAAVGVDGVAEAHVDLSHEKLAITTDGTVPAPTLRAAIIAAVGATGYSIAQEDFS